MKCFRRTALLIAFCTIIKLCNAQIADQLPFWNPKLTFDQRADDVVSRLTLEEKVAQMLNKAPAIPRLNIPAYEW